MKVIKKIIEDGSETHENISLPEDKIFEVNRYIYTRIVSVSWDVNKELIKEEIIKKIINFHSVVYNNLSRYNLKESEVYNKINFKTKNYDKSFDIKKENLLSSYPKDFELIMVSTPSMVDIAYEKDKNEILVNSFYDVHNEISNFIKETSEHNFNKEDITTILKEIYYDNRHKTK